MLQAKNETFVQAAESDLARDLAYAYYYKVWSNLIVTAVIPMGKLNLALWWQFYEWFKQRIDLFL